MRSNSVTHSKIPKLDFNFNRPSIKKVEGSMDQQKEENKVSMNTKSLYMNKLNMSTIAKPGSDKNSQVKNILTGLVSNGSTKATSNTNSCKNDVNY